MTDKMNSLNKFEMFCFIAGMPMSALQAIGSCAWECGGGTIAFNLDGFVEDFISNLKLNNVSVIFTSSIDTAYAITSPLGTYNTTINVAGQENVSVQVIHSGYQDYTDLIPVNPSICKTQVYNVSLYPN